MIYELMKNASCHHQWIPGALIRNWALVQKLTKFNGYFLKCNKRHNNYYDCWFLQHPICTHCGITFTKKSYCPYQYSFLGAMLLFHPFTIYKRQLPWLLTSVNRFMTILLWHTTHHDSSTKLKKIGLVHQRNYLLHIFFFTNTFDHMHLVHNMYVYIMNAYVWITATYVLYNIFCLSSFQGSKLPYYIKHSICRVTILLNNLKKWKK